jgi:F420-non-reducing hydrogenase iron-sulfur subunit
MTWKPHFFLFQCQYCLASADDQNWVENKLPENVKLIKTPCSGRISPMFILNAIQGGADGVLVSGCMPEKCHYKSGNLGARRQLDEFARILEYLGMEKGRIRFVWMDINERGLIQKELALFEQELTKLGPAKKFAREIILQKAGE